MMDRYILFAGPDYYPAGGWRDYIGSYNTLSEAIGEVANIANIEWWHVVDSSTAQTIKHGKRKP